MRQSGAQSTAARPRNAARAEVDHGDPYDTLQFSPDRRYARGADDTDPGRTTGRIPRINDTDPGRTTERTGSRAAGRAAPRPPGPDQPADGLSALLGFLLSLGLATVCGIAGAVVLNSVGLMFAAGFVLGALYVACRIRQPDLLWAVIIPPITFAISLFVSGLFEEGKGGGNALVNQAIGMSTALAAKAPVLLSAECLVTVIALVRLISYRRHTTRRPARTQRR